MKNLFLCTWEFLPLFLQTKYNKYQHISKWQSGDFRNVTTGEKCWPDPVTACSAFWPKAGVWLSVLVFTAFLPFCLLLLLLSHSVLYWQTRISPEHRVQMAQLTQTAAAWRDRVTRGVLPPLQARQSPRKPPKASSFLWQLVHWRHAEKRGENKWQQNIR